MPEATQQKMTIEPVAKVRPIDYLAIITAAALWGGSFASTKIALAQADAIMIIWLRFLISIPPLVLGTWYSRALRFPTKKEAIPLFLMGFQGIFFHQTIQAYAMRTAGAANGNWVMVASPALVSILGWIFLKEKISKTGIVGLVLSALGVALVLALGTIKSAAFAGFGSMGDMILIFSVFNWAAFLIISRKVLRHDLPPSFTILWEMVAALICASIFLVATRADFSQIASYNATTWKSILFLGIFSSALAYLFWFHGLSKLPVARVVIFQFIQPLAGIFVSYFFVGERFTIWLYLGGLLIISGVWLVNKKH
ncbi:DMT family transporter [Synergistaceae bacterium OttesenSCG-928-D05]|nr:DMT family transporter [Synergistaceae bacterium OttesenSCG-928-D05]